MIDSSFGFEMETFEFLNICQVHGFPRIMGVLTHMDMFKSFKQLKKTKKRLKHRFWTEIYQGAKLFYLNGLVNAEYKKQEVHNLARFISVMKFKEMGFRSNHPYLIADRMEDLTEPDLIRQNAKCDRNVCLYGYVRGCPIKRNTNIHIPGVGDFELNDVSFLPDPCPLPDSEKHRRTLDERERLIYAPFSGVGGIVYDKDAVYIELGGSHSHNKKSNNGIEFGAPTNEYVENIISSKHTLDAKLQQSKLQLFSETKAISNEEYDEKARSSKTNMSEENVEMISDNENDSENEDEEINEEDENGLEDEEEDDENGFDSNEDDDENGFGTDDDDDENGFDTDEDGDESEKENFMDNDDDDDDNNLSSRWKENLKLRASLNFEKNKKVNWSKLVYGNQPANAYYEENNKKMEEDNNNKDENKEFGGLFKVTKHTKEEKLDSVKFKTNFIDWNFMDNFETIRDCFVTGTWEKNKDAQELLNNDNDDDDKNDNDDDSDVWDAFDEDPDDEMFGDFVDLETGKVHEGSTKRKKCDNGPDEDDGPEKEETEEDHKAKREKLMEKKKQLKEKFDAEFDSKELDAKADAESAFYEALKKEVDEQTIRNRMEFDKMDDETRVQYEGFRPGMYVRIQINNMPCEFVNNFDAKYLAIIGGLSVNESNIGYVQVRIKKHRWFNKTLKTKDPLIISLGWRRFQTIPMFFIQDHNMRNRSLKYTPQHMHCHATFWGPITPQNTGFLAIQSLSSETNVS